MALPEGIPTVRVTARYLLPDGRPLSGRVVFRAPSLITFGEEDVMLSGPVTVPLDEQGRIEVRLPATDAPGMNPSGWAYAVAEQLEGVPSNRTYNILLPAETRHVDLADIAPTDPTTPTYVAVRGDSAYEVAVENGFEGTVEEWLASLVGPPGPAGSVDTVNGIAPDPSGNVALTAPDIGAAPVDHTHTPEQVGAVPATAKGSPGGVAELDDTGRVPAEQLPEASGGNVTLPVIDVTAPPYNAPTDGVADAAPAIQAALTDAYDQGGAQVYVPPGTYRLATLPLRQRRNVRLTLAPGAVFRRAADATMLTNGDAGQTMGGYTGHGGLIIEGGIWDMAATAPGLTASRMCISLGHAQNITIRDLTIRDTPGYHAIELNAIKTARITGCSFLGYTNPDGTRDFSEAIQLDLAKSSAHYGAFGPYDDTPCADVLVQGCTFGASGTPGTVAWPRGIGSHSASPSKPHRDIRIIGCRVEGAAQWAVGAYTWESVVIEGLQVRDCGGGVWVRTLDSSRSSHRTPAGGTAPTITGSQPLTGIVVSDLTMTGGGGYGAAIQVEGESTGYVGNLAIDNVTVDDVAGLGVRLAYVEDYTVRGVTVTGSGGTGVSTLGTRRGKIATSHVNGAGRAGFTLDSRSTPAETATDVTISGCSATATAVNGFHVWAGADITIDGCEAYNLTGYGVQISTGTARPVVRGMRTRGTTLAGVNLTSTVTDPVVDSPWRPLGDFGAFQTGVTPSAAAPPQVRDVFIGGVRYRAFRGVLDLSGVGTGGFTMFAWNTGYRVAYERNWTVATDASTPARLYMSTSGNMGLTAANGSTRLDIEQIGPIVDPPGTIL